MKRMSQGLTLSWVLLMALGVFTAACGDEDGDASSSDAAVSAAGNGGRAGRGGSGGRSGSGRSGRGDSGGDGMAEAGIGGGGGTGGTGNNGGRGRADAGVQLSDGAIIAVLAAANTGEIDLGNIAIKRASSASALSYAQNMVAMHTGAQARQSALAQAQNLSSQDNTVSDGLRNTALQAAAKLDAVSAAGFDLTYVQSQVEIHSNVLQLIDDTLLPSVSNPALQTELTSTRAVVQEHLAAAETLSEALRATVEDAAVDDAGADDAGAP